MNAVAETVQIGKLVAAFRETIMGFTLVPFNDKWPNGTGYMDNAEQGPEAPKLAPGETVRSVDPHGRNVAMVGTIAGNCVVFERFINGDRDVIVSNVPSLVRKLVDMSPGALKTRDLELIFGLNHGLRNVGFRIQNLIDLNDKLKAAQATNI